MAQGGFTKVPKVRNAHGTRVSKRIVCSACGASDTLHFVPRREDSLCRPCAAKQLGIADPDSGIFPERNVRCATCGRPGRTNASPLSDHHCEACRAATAPSADARAPTAERIDGGKVLRVRRPAKSEGGER
jgi:NMD protein affecting ribosome stability and mRNA decay